MIAVFLLGNATVLFVTYRTIPHLIDHRLIFLIPLAFTLVCTGAITIGIRSGLARSTCRHHTASLVVFAIIAMTWAGIMYVILRNLFPNTL